MIRTKEEVSELIEDFWHQMSIYEHTCICAAISMPPCQHCENCTVCNCHICSDYHETVSGDVCTLCAACGEEHDEPWDLDCPYTDSIGFGLTYSSLRLAMVEQDTMEVSPTVRLSSMARVVALDIIARLKTTNSGSLIEDIQDAYELTYDLDESQEFNDPH